MGKHHSPARFQIHPCPSAPILVQPLAAAPRPGILQEASRYTAMSILRKLFSSKDKSIVVVSGPPRSGTSMMMKMLEAGGLPPLTDRLRRPDVDNPRGYYEFEPVKRLDKGDVSWLPTARGKAVKIISALLRHLPADHRYHVVFMERQIDELLASQRSMLIHRGEDPDAVDDLELANAFEKHLRQVREYLSRQDHLSVLYVNYNDVLADPGRQARRVARFLPHDLDANSMAAVVDPSLYRNR